MKQLEGNSAKVKIKKIAFISLLLFCLSGIGLILSVFLIPANAIVVFVFLGFILASFVSFLIFFAMHVIKGEVK